MSVYEKIKAILELKARPMLQSHGGDLRLVEYANGIVRIELLGACCGCPSADLSTRLAIEELLRASVPEVEKVELTEDLDLELLSFAQKYSRYGESR